MQAGKGSVPALIETVGEPSQVVSIADFSAPERGARATSGAEERATYALAAVAGLFRTGSIRGQRPAGVPARRRCRSASFE